MDVSDVKLTYFQRLNKPIIGINLRTIARIGLEKKVFGSTIYEKDCYTSTYNDTYNRDSMYRVHSGKDYFNLDLDFITRDPTNCLKGNLSSPNDVDIYQFSVPFVRILQNQFGFSANIELPNKDDCNIILYDKYGNQLGRAEKISDTQRKLSVPNWDVNCSDYAIKIFNKQGEELKNIPYKLSFKVENNPDHEKTDLLCVTYSKLRQQYAKNDPDYMNTVNYYN